MSYKVLEEKRNTRSDSRVVLECNVGDERKFMKSYVGDILITFNATTNDLPSRSISPWKEIAKYSESTLWMTATDEHWRGFPLQTYQDDRFQVWALGEFYGAQPDLPLALETSPDFNGHFLIIVYERYAKRWHVITDRFGTVHAYLAEDGARASIGTFSPAVAQAASAKQLDWEAIAGFFTYGFFLSDKTYWRDLRIIQPATHLVLDRDGQVISEEKTWHWHHEPDQSLSFKEALAEFEELFETVIRDHVHGKTVALPLSGGLDSRSTLIPLTTSDQGGAERLFSFSYGYGDDSVETKIAGQLAQLRGLYLKTWAIKPYLFNQMEHISSASEGFYDLVQCRQAYVVDDLAAQTTHILAAHWGDVWLDDMGFLGGHSPLSEGALAFEIVDKFAKKGSQPLLALFKDSLPQERTPHLEDLIQSQLSGLKAIQETDFKVKAWKTQTWSFRWTLASLRSYQVGLFPVLPFYDQRLTDFFCSLPSPMVSGRRLQIEYLKANAPDLARVPWQTYDANLYNYQHFNNWQLPKRAVKKLARILSGKQVIERNWEVQFLNDRGRRGLQDWLLTPGLKIHDITPKKKLDSILSDFYDMPDAGKGYAISMLLTFSAWLEHYG